MGSYDRLDFEVRPEVMRGFLAGWSAGRGWSREETAQRLVWPDEWNIQVDSKLQELVDAVLPEDDCVVLVRHDTVDELLEALSPWERQLRVKLHARRRVTAASFAFSFEFFARPEADAVRQIFESLPDGVEVSEDYQPVEHSDASASGAEMYAPVHAYTFSGHGTISGNLRGVLQVSERAHQHERIHRKAIRLQLATGSKTGGP